LDWRTLRSAKRSGTREQLLCGTASKMLRVAESLNFYGNLMLTNLRYRSWELNLRAISANNCASASFQAIGRGEIG